MAKQDATTSAIADVVAAKKRVDEAVRVLLARRQELSTQRDALRNELAEWNSAPVPAALVKEFMLSLVDRLHDYFAPQWRALFHAAAAPTSGDFEAASKRPRLSLGAIERLTAQVDDDKLGAFFPEFMHLARAGQYKDPHHVGMVFVLLSEPLKAFIEKRFEEYAPPVFLEGQPDQAPQTITAARAHAAALEERISAVEAELSEVNGQLAELQRTVK